MFTLTFNEVFWIFVFVSGLALIICYLGERVDDLKEELKESQEAYEFMQDKCKEANADKIKYIDIIDLLSEKDR